MEYAQNEIQVVADATLTADANAVKELTELELALIGGGSGEVVPH